MNLYLDSSALVKCFVMEASSALVQATLGDAEMAASALITRVEVESAFAKAVRVGALSETDAREAQGAFHRTWPDLVRIQVSDFIVAHAGELVWTHGLRAYDAVHLATALLWQSAIDESVTFATFDRKLWQAAQITGLKCFPRTFD